MSGSLAERGGEAAEVPGRNPGITQRGRSSWDLGQEEVWLVSSWPKLHSMQLAPQWVGFRTLHLRDQQMKIQLKGKQNLATGQTDDLLVCRQNAGG